jgi:hypothetical protein
LRTMEMPRAAGPVVMCIGEVFRDRATLDTLDHESLLRQIAAAR